MNFQEFAKNQRKDLPVDLTPERCKGRTYILTGANTGLGFECAKHLVGLGCSRLVMAVRSISRGETAKSAIEDSSGRKDVIQVWHLDLTSYNSVIIFAKKAEVELERVDGIVANAGICNGNWEEVEGMESNLAVNVISNMLFVTLMMPLLKMTAEKFRTNPHLSVVGSMSAFTTHAISQELEADNLLEELNTREKWLSEMNSRYSVSKLLLHQAIRRLADNAPVSRTGVIVNIVSPGLCKTNLNRNSKLFPRFLIFIFKAILGRTAEMGSRNLIHGLAAGVDSHGMYLSDCEIKEFDVPEWMTDVDGTKFRDKVWTSTAKKLVEIEPGIMRIIDSL